MNEHEMLREVIRRQNEIWQAVMISNWLAVAGRILEIAIASMLGLILVRMNALCRRSS